MSTRTKKRFETIEHYREFIRLMAEEPVGSAIEVGKKRNYSVPEFREESTQVLRAMDLDLVLNLYLLHDLAQKALPDESEHKRLNRAVIRLCELVIDRHAPAPRTGS